MNKKKILVKSGATAFIILIGSCAYIVLGIEELFGDLGGIGRTGVVASILIVILLIWFYAE